MWCCAGSSHPTLFIDTPVSVFQSQIDSNYLTSLYMAHATLTAWLRPKSPNSAGPKPLARHMIFTASFVSFYTFAGYSAYSPTKAALRSLSDSLSQEMNLYAAANPLSPVVKLHTIFPATIFTAGYEEENRVKTDLTRMLEGDEGQTPDVVARKSIKGLESGYELVPTDFLTRLVMCGVLGGSTRGGFLKGCTDGLLAAWMWIVMLVVRWDFDSKVWKWGKRYGDSGMRREGDVNKSS